MAEGFGSVAAPAAASCPPSLSDWVLAPMQVLITQAKDTEPFLPPRTGKQPDSPRNASWVVLSALPRLQLRETRAVSLPEQCLWK